jgi:hypothetical protein
MRLTDKVAVQIGQITQVVGNKLYPTISFASY